MEKIRRVTITDKIPVKDVFKLGTDKRVKVGGWAENVRIHGGVCFINLRDGSGSIQITLKRGVTKNYDEVSKRLTEETSLMVVGITRKDERAPQGLEIIGEGVEIIHTAEPYPILKGVGKSFLLDNRHLYLRRPKMRAIIKLREKALKAIREWFGYNDFVEVQAPIFITAAVEGGATLFPVKYFGNKAYLTQSSQFYLEAAIFAFERVYSIEPSFRAEKSRTRKHLTEFWHIEAEVAFASHEDIMKIEEELIYHVTKRLVEWGKEELKILGREDFKPPEPPYYRITYDEALQIAEEKGIKVKWGEDLGAAAERIISLSFDKPVFITGFPLTTRAFYHMPDPKDPRKTLSSDLYAPEGVGEITTGGQRIHDLNLLLKRIREEGLDTKDYEWYIDLRRYGSVPHSGFGLGLERLLKWVCRLDHVRDATLFPRTPARVYP